MLACVAAHAASARRLRILLLASIRIGLIVCDQCPYRLIKNCLECFCRTSTREEFLWICLPGSIACDEPTKPNSSATALNRLASKSPAISQATVSRILCRRCLNRVASWDPAEPVWRYERKSPGELINIDSEWLDRIERTGNGITATAPARAKAAGPAGMPSNPHRRPCGWHIRRS